MANAFRSSLSNQRNQDSQQGRQQPRELILNKFPVEVNSVALLKLKNFCDKNQVIRCSKLNKMGIGWNLRDLKITHDSIEYFNIGKFPSRMLIKGKVPLHALVQFTDPSNPLSLSITKNCLTITFASKFGQTFKNGIEQPNKLDSGHTMWVFKIEKKHGDPFDDKQIPPDQIPLSQIQNPQNKEPEPLPVVSDLLQFESQVTFKGKDEETNTQNQGTSDQQGKPFQTEEKKKERMQIKWDFRYGKLWNEYYQNMMTYEKNDIETEIRHTFTIFAFLGEFRRFCVENVKRLVHELVFPKKWRQFKEIQNDHPMYQFKQKNEMAYFVDGIFYRLTYITIGSDDKKANNHLIEIPKKSEFSFGKVDEINSNNAHKNNISSSNSNFNSNNGGGINFSQSEQLYNLQTKMISHEFRTNSVIADCINQLSAKDHSYSIKIPLTCLVDYLGFTCLCSSVVPLLLVNYSLQKLIIQVIYFIPKPSLRRMKDQGENKQVSYLLRQEEDANTLSMIQGMKRNGEYIESENENLKRDLELLGQHLRLRPFFINGVSVNPFQQNNNYSHNAANNSSSNNNNNNKIIQQQQNQKQIEINLSLFSEVHCVKSKDLLLSELKHEVEGETISSKIKRMKILNGKQKKSDKSDIQDQSTFYLFKTATIFPLQIDVESNKLTCLFRFRLRPEFLCLINSFLSNGAFLNQNSLVNTDYDDMMLASAGQKLKREAIDKLVRDLETMEVQPIGTEQLSQTFHLYGVNMRHLGLVVQRTSLPHIKEICQVDMFARSTKKILRAHLAEFILRRYKGSNCDSSSAMFDRLQDIFEIKYKDEKEQYEGAVLYQEEENEEDYYEKIRQREEKEKKMNNEVYDEDIDYQNKFDDEVEELKSNVRFNFYQFLKSIYIDYLNLVFSQDPESIAFRQNILRPQILQDFAYDISGIQFWVISQGYFLHAISFHWRIEFKQEESIKIFTSSQPFDEATFSLSVGVHSKIYQYRSLNLIKTIDEYNDSIQKQQYDLANKYLEIKRQIVKLTMESEYTAPAPKKVNLLIIEIINTQMKKLKDCETQQEQRKKEMENNKGNKKNKKAQKLLQSQHTANNQQYLMEMSDVDMLSAYNQFEEEVKKQLSCIPFNHAERIHIMTTLIEVYKQQSKYSNNEEISEKKNNDCMDTYQKIQQIIEYHLGKHHPLVAELYALQSEYHFSINKDDQGQKYLIEAIKKSKQILGASHIKISGLYRKQAEIFLKSNQNYKALQFLEQAKSIHETQFGYESINSAWIYFDISYIYFCTSRLQNGFDLCDRAFKIFMQQEQKYLTQCLNCCYQCCKAALNLLQPKEVIEYSNKIWHLLKKYYNDKVMKKLLREQFNKFIFKALIRIIVLTMKVEERNFLFSIMLYDVQEKQQQQYLKDSINSSMLQSQNMNQQQYQQQLQQQQQQLQQQQQQLQQQQMNKNPNQMHTQITLSDINNFNQFHEEQVLQQLDASTIFDDVRDQHKFINVDLSNDSQYFLRAGLYPDNRIFDLETHFIQEQQKFTPEQKKKKREFFDDLLPKDSQANVLDVIKTMFNDILSKKKFIPQKDFFDNYKKYLLKNADDLKQESQEMYKMFMEIFGNLFFYQLYKSPIFINIKILDYEQR